MTTTTTSRHRRSTSLLCRALLIFGFALGLPLIRAKTSLDPVGIYGSIAQAQACLSITWRTARQQLGGPVAANCLRFAFHDAGSYQTSTDQGGANGSIMKELDFNIFKQNNGLTLCAQAMPVILAAARNAGCPQLTAADAIQVAGAVAVASKGGPACSMLMGRPDKATADDLSGLPSECDDANALIRRFSATGFTDPATSLVVLSGAHNIGRSQVTVRSACSKGLGPLTDSDIFDGHYYREVVDQTGKRGWFSSDNNIARPGTPTVNLMTTYARNSTAFLTSWCKHYREASLLGVDTVRVAGLSIDDGWDPNAAPATRPSAPPRPIVLQPARPPARPLSAKPLARPAAPLAKPGPGPRRNGGGGGGGGGGGRGMKGIRNAAA